MIDEGVSILRYNKWLATQAAIACVMIIRDKEKLVVSARASFLNFLIAQANFKKSNKG